MKKIDPPQGNFYHTVSNLRGFGFILKKSFQMERTKIRFLKNFGSKFNPKGLPEGRNK